VIKCNNADRIAKYSIEKFIFNKEVDETLKDICLEISKRFEIGF